jgi:hypothetical protein
MAAESPDRPEGERRVPAGAPVDADASPRAGEERYGPLAIARLRKDDGRALILYASAGTPP